jgi:hypothetical protein
VNLQRSVGNQAVVGLLSETAPDEQLTVGDVRRRLGSGHPAEGAARNSIEAQTGADLRDVRVHTGSAADALCREFEARAFTLGTDIVVADREYAAGTPDGERLLAHELTHVVQQGVRPPPFEQRLEVGAVNDPAEHEAEAVAECVASSGAE